MIDSVGWQGLATHLQSIPLPFLVQHWIGQIAYMHPLLGLLIPSSARRNDMQMRVVLAIASMCLDHDNVTALEGLATHRAKEIVQAFHPTLHEGTEQHVGVLIKRRSQYIRHGQDNMPIDDTFMEHLPNLSHPIIHIDLGAS